MEGNFTPLVFWQVLYRPLGQALYILYYILHEKSKISLSLLRR
nr:MAG TPA: hypothetical protein [Caudoviricetes sp.]